jgi:hypothetical protein
MSYNGSGTFQINTSGQPVVTGTVISSSAFNALTADLATGLSTAITKDGQTATTVRIPFAQGINSSLTTDTSSGSTGSIFTAGGVGITKGLFVGGTATFSATPVFSALTASSAVATDASKNLVSVTNTGTGNNVLATSPTLVTPALGTPSSGVVTNLTGTASININGTVGATTPTTGAFTTVSATGVTTVQAGTAAAPAITTSGDTNTGIFFPAADTIAFSEGGAESMRIDSSGNVGIGTTSPSTYANGNGPVLVTGTGNNFATIQGRTDGPSGSSNGVSYGGSYSTNPINGSRITFNAEGSSGQRGSVSFWTKALDDNSTQPLERMRIDTSGNLLIGTTSGWSSAVKFQVSGSASSFTRAGTGNDDQIYFRNDNGIVGSISTNGSLTSYNVSSDYRLKQDIVPMTGALAKVSALKPVTYKWKSDSSDGEGFIAHQLAEVCPQAVTGAKDAVDEDGNPRYQGIDVSFVVATLTAAIQEQQALITSLTARIVALEAK